MKDSMKEQSTVDIKRGICCFKFAEMMLGLNMGVSVPFQGVLELLEVVAKNGGDPAMDFFVAVCVGHRIHEHGDTLQVAIDFAEWSGVPDLHIKARPATASDIISDCLGHHQRLRHQPRVDESHHGGDDHAPCGRGR